MRDSYGEGLATQPAPSHAQAPARVFVEALTGERTGWVLNRENCQTSGCRRCTEKRKATRPTTPWRVARSILRGLRPQARSETSCQGTGRSHGRPQVTKNGLEARAVKPNGRPTAMHDHGKSDSCVVPKKSANEVSGASLAEEQMEGRRLANSNSPDCHSHRAQSRTAAVTDSGANTTGRTTCAFMTGGKSPVR